MTRFAGTLAAKKPVAIRAITEDVRSYTFAGSLFVPKRMSDGRFPLIDVWHFADRTYIVPFSKKMERPKGYIGWADLLGPSPDSALLGGRKLARVHTSHAVEPQGFGFGFVLYAAAALAAMTRTSFWGVFSPDDTSVADRRSRDADAVWDRLKTIPFRGTPLAHRHKLKATPDDIDGSTFDFVGDVLTGAAVLNSGLVVRIGRTTKQGLSFTPPPNEAQRAFAYDVKYVIKKR